MRLELISLIASNMRLELISLIASNMIPIAVLILNL